MERISLLMEKRKKKEKDVLANIKFNMKIKLEPVKKFNTKQQEVTQKMRIKN